MFYDKNSLPVRIGDAICWKSGNNTTTNGKVVRQETRGEEQVLIIAFMGVEAPFRTNDIRSTRLVF